MIVAWFKRDQSVKRRQGTVSVFGKEAHILDSLGVPVVKYVYDAWGNHRVLNPNGTENTTDNFIGNINPIRYRSYYYDTEIGLYYLNARYYDPETGRFISPDDISYLDPETIGGTNIYAYCNNNPVMYIDPTGHSPEWWQWLVSGLQIIGGIALRFVPGAQTIGVGLIVSGTSMLTSNILSAVGVNGKIASIITSSLNIIAGIALCFTPFAGLGASMIGSGIGGITGGFISESFGGSFELGSAIGNIIGSFLGGQIYKGLVNHGAIPFKASARNIVENPRDDINNPNVGPKQGLIVDKIHQIQQTGKYEIIDVIKLSNGTYQVQDGHHTLRALISLGYKYIWIQFTK